MPQFKVRNLWPTPVYEAEIPVEQKWKNIITNFDYERTPIGNSDITKDRYIFENNLELKDLEEKIKNHCEIFVKKYLHIKNNVEFYLQNSWVNVHNPNDESQVHYHGNSLISGVYYPILPDGSGNITFHKNHLLTNLFHPCIKIEYEEHDNINCDFCTVDIKEGSIVLFPSHLEHSVERNKTSEKRYSIAFNFFVRGTLGKKEFILDLK